MSKAVQTSTQLEAAAPVVSFAEVACFNKYDQFRSSFTPVVFRLFSVGRGLGQKVDVEFTDTYRLYYDSDDENLIAALRGAAPGLPWGTMMYHRWLDQSRIQVVHPERGTIVAQIETRRYYGRKVCESKLVAGEYGGTVVSLAAAKAARAAAVIEAENG